MSIGTTIKKLRRDRNITQEQLAELLGVSTNAVSQWECDKTAPDISNLPVLANIFEVSADVLLEIDIATSNEETLGHTYLIYLDNNDTVFTSIKNTPRYMKVKEKLSNL